VPPGAPLVALGRTHASTVIPVVRSRLAESGIVTQLLVPLNESAPPKRPEALQVAPLIVPVLPLPDASAVVPPPPSLNPYAATSPVCAAAGSGTARSGRMAQPTASRGRTRSMTGSDLSQPMREFAGPSSPLQPPLERSKRGAIVAGGLVVSRPRDIGARRYRRFFRPFLAFVDLSDVFSESKVD
jgi:hypothetical protein